jgi:FkbM family methyltransferase
MYLCLRKSYKVVPKMSAPIISYAQNQEDVILYRALRDVSKGFYIDVGAQQPVVDSVTKLFYERGWHGINIDPVPQWRSMLEADRPHDINLQMAVGAHRGQMPFFVIPDTGLSTANPEFSAQHARMGFTTQKITAEVQTLDEICALYGVREVHFLKIDVEGGEKNVISGFSFDPIRPWVVVVEAIEPVSGRRDEPDAPPQAIPTHEEWEPLLLAHGYEFVYWDGLNRFYLAREHQALRPRFSAPPNPLDEFVRNEELNKHHRIVQLEAERKALTERISSTQSQIAALKQDKDHLVQDKAQLEQDRIHLFQLYDERDALRSERDMLRGQHEALCGERDTLRSERDVLRGQHEALCGERDTLRSERDVLRGQHEALCSERDTLRDERDVLCGQHEALCGERDALRDERDTLCGERKALRDERDALRGQYDGLRNERDALRSELDWHASHRAHLEQTLAQQQTTLDAILHSRSWRVTGPLRGLTRQLREIRSLPRRSMRRVLLVALHLVRNQVTARRMARSVLALAPVPVRNRLLRFAQFHSSHFHPGAANHATMPTNLAVATVEPALQSAGVQIIYARLRNMAVSN